MTQFILFLLTSVTHFSPMSTFLYLLKTSDNQKYVIPQGNNFLFSHVLHVLNNLQSPDPILLVYLRISSKKSARKSIRYRNIIFEYYLFIVRFRANFC